MHSAHVSAPPAVQAASMDIAFDSYSTGTVPDPLFVTPEPTPSRMEQGGRPRHMWVFTVFTGLVHPSILHDGEHGCTHPNRF